MTKHARKKGPERRTTSGERPSTRGIPVAAPVADIAETVARRHPRTVNRPAKTTEEGYVTLGFRGTPEDDELVRRAAELGGYSSKADLIRRAAMDLAEKTIEEQHDANVGKIASSLGISRDELQTLLVLAKKRKK